MSPKRLLFTLAMALLPAMAAAQGSGQLAGSVTGTGGPLAGVTVVINEAAMAEITDDNGNYLLTGLPPGSYTVSFSLGDNSQEAQVTVEPGKTARLDQTVDWDVSYAETITVYSASRRRERIVEAPAAVTVVSEQELSRETSTGQLAKVLEFTPGAEVTQSGLYDFNLNTRGFNSSLNRRVPALIDGRDPTIPFLSSNDWASMSSIGDMASVELVRGPSSALYGTNAYNGVLVLTTKQPRFSEGGTVQLTAGELSTLRGDARWSGGLSESNYLKVNGSYTKSDDFYQSRNTRVEYSHFCSAAELAPGAAATRSCFTAREATPLKLTEDKLWLAGLRFDHYFGESFLTLEGGSSYVEGVVVQTGIGRVQILEQDRPWARANFSHPHFNVLSYYNKREAPKQTALASGANLALDEQNWAVEVQGNADFAGTKGRVIAGASYKEEEIDTRNAAGVATLSNPPTLDAYRQAGYAQLEYSFTPKFKALAAGRYDDSDLHDGQFSPKVAFVIAPTPNQTIRLTYNEAFQSPNYSEFFLAAPAGLPTTALSALAALDPRLASVPVLARGNNALDVEEIKTWEVGYSGILGGKAFVTIDYYNSELTGFVTDLLRGVNPAFSAPGNPYVPPASLPPALQAQLRALTAGVAGFTMVNGNPAIVASYANAGSADTQGIDFGLNYYITNNWNFSANYSWFDFELKDQQLGDLVEPNAPENHASLGLGYVGDRFDFSVGFRWVDGFRWAAGVFVGDVPSYEVVDVGGNWKINDHIRLGVNVSNALDKEHYQSFGGDLISRRALGNVTFTW
ncbi:MAG TPA: TonB-dependent receptor [Thermoanaerobaculia bacterium]|nr:TonB-dependent receptor [Thermoanaerobaculia bacterium]